MKIIAKATASIKKGMDREFKALTEGIKAGTQDAGRALQSSLRKQVVTAGMKKRLANTWRFKFFPNKGFNPASFVFSKAPEIIRAFDKGVLIRKPCHVCAGQAGKDSQKARCGEISQKMGRKNAGTD